MDKAVGTFITMNEKTPEYPSGTGEKFSRPFSGESFWGVSLFLKLMVLGIGAGFVYWVGWPQPALPVHPLPSTSDSEIRSPTSISSGPADDTSDAVAYNFSGRNVRGQPPQGMADKKTIQPGVGNTYLVDLNDGTPAEFEHLPGIGSILAGRIVAHRTSHGAFRRVEDLLLVPGIGEKRLQQLRPLVGVRERSL